MSETGSHHGEATKVSPTREATKVSPTREQMIADLSTLTQMVAQTQVMLQQFMAVSNKGVTSTTPPEAPTEGATVAVAPAEGAALSSVPPEAPIEGAAVAVAPIDEAAIRGSAQLTEASVGPAPGTRGFPRTAGTLNVPRLSIPKFDGTDEAFASWSIRFKSYCSSMGLRDVLFRKQNHVRIGETGVDESTLLARGHTPVEIEEAYLAQYCLLEAMISESMLFRVNGHKSPSEAWIFLTNWFSPKCDGEHRSWLYRFNSLRMSPGESPIDYFARADTTVDMLCSLGTDKSDSKVLAQLAEGLTSDYSLQYHMYLADEKMSRVRFESIVRNRHLQLVGKHKLKGRTDHALFARGASRGRSGGGRGSDRDTNRHVNVRGHRGKSKASGANFSGTPLSKSSTRRPKQHQISVDSVQHLGCTVRCYNCQGYGHLSSECTSQRGLGRTHHGQPLISPFNAPVASTTGTQLAAGPAYAPPATYTVPHHDQPFHPPLYAKQHGQAANQKLHRNESQMIMPGSFSFGGGNALIRSDNNAAHRCGIARTGPMDWGIRSRES